MGELDQDQAELPSWQFATGQWLVDRMRLENAEADAGASQPAIRLSAEDVQALERVAKGGSRHIYFTPALETQFREEQRASNLLPRVLICAIAVICYGSAPLWAGWVFGLPPASEKLAAVLCLSVVAPVHLLAGAAQYRWVTSEAAEFFLLVAFSIQLAFLELIRVHASTLGLHLGPMLTASTVVSIYSMINLSLPKRSGLLVAYFAILFSSYLMSADPRTHLGVGEWLGAVLLVSLSLVGSMFFRISVRRGWAANRLLEVSATQDILTGLPNRLAFLNHLQTYLASARRYDKICLMALVDLDHFKKINDRYGHEYGDGVLMEVGLCLSQFSRRAGDIVARFGGEEFAIFLYDCKLEGAKSRLNDLLDSVCDLGIDHEDNHGGIVTVSVGAAMLSPTATMSQAYQAADKHLYEAKSSGRNRIVFDPHIV